MTRTTHTGSADAALDQRLSDELDAHNVAATSDVPPAEELTVRITDGDELVAGVSGWTWGEAAGIAMTWVDAGHRGEGLGAELLRAFEHEARRRGCLRVFTTSFTFQAPDFYRAHGYEEQARWSGVPTSGRDDVHLVKTLT